MTILAIDTSTSWCSVAIVNTRHHGASSVAPLIYQKHEDIGPGSSNVLLPWVDDLLIQAKLSLGDLDAIAVGLGPGAFTGIRIAVGVAQGLSFGLNCPTVGVACTDVVAADAARHFLKNEVRIQEADRMLIALDARMGEVYWAWYECQNQHDWSRITDIQLSKADAVDYSLAQGRYFMAGSGLHADKIAFEPYLKLALGSDARALPCADVLGLLALKLVEQGRTVTSEDLQPLYIRDKVAQTIAERRHA